MVDRCEFIARRLSQLEAFNSDKKNKLFLWNWKSTYQTNWYLCVWQMSTQYIFIFYWYSHKYLFLSGLLYHCQKYFGRKFCCGHQMFEQFRILSFGKSWMFPPFIRFITMFMLHFLFGRECVAMFQRLSKIVLKHKKFFLQSKKCIPNLINRSNTIEFVKNVLITPLQNSK